MAARCELRRAPPQQNETKQSETEERSRGWLGDDVHGRRVELQQVAEVPDGGRSGARGGAEATFEEVEADVEQPGGDVRAVVVGADVHLPDHGSHLIAAREGSRCRREESRAGEVPGDALERTHESRRVAEHVEMNWREEV